MLYLGLEVLSDRDWKFSVSSTQLLSISMDKSWVWGSKNFLYSERLALECVGFEVCCQCNLLHPRPADVELFLEVSYFKVDDVQWVGTASLLQPGGLQGIEQDKLLEVGIQSLKLYVLYVIWTIYRNFHRLLTYSSSIFKTHGNHLLT